MASWFPYQIHAEAGGEPAAVSKDRRLIIWAAGLGVPYTAADIANAQKNLADQAAKIVTNLKVGSINNVPPDREILAVIAYLQRLGTDIKAQPAPVAAAK